MRSKTLRVILSSDCVILSKAKDLICNKDQSLKGVMLYENQLEILGPGGPHPGRPHFCGGCAGVYRHRRGGAGGCELAGGAECRRVRVCDGDAVGTDGVAGGESVQILIWVTDIRNLNRRRGVTSASACFG